MLPQRFGGLMQGVAHGGHLADGVEQAVVVNEIFVAHDRCVHAGGVEMARVSEALVAQHIGAGHLDQRGRQSLQLLCRGLQRRGIDFTALRSIRSIGVPEPLHHCPREEIALREFVIRARVEICVRHRPEQDLAFELRPALVQGLERDGGGHVSADAVAEDGQAACIHPDLCAVGSDPLRGGVDFVDRGGIFRLGRWRVVDEDSGEPAIGDEISDEALVRREVAEDPAAAVDEEEARAECRCCRPGARW